jgi:hypothetical protein
MEREASLQRPTRFVHWTVTREDFFGRESYPRAMGKLLAVNLFSSPAPRANS